LLKYDIIFISGNISLLCLFSCLPTTNTNISPLFYLPSFQILINNCRSCNTSLLINSDETNKHWMYSFFCVLLGFYFSAYIFRQSTSFFLLRDFSRYCLWTTFPGWHPNAILLSSLDYGHEPPMPSWILYF
jgi:hypothetical protein